MLLLVVIVLWLLGNATFVAMRLRATRSPSDGSQDPTPRDPHRDESSRAVSIAGAFPRRPRRPGFAVTATASARSAIRMAPTHG